MNTVVFYKRTAFLYCLAALISVLLSVWIDGHETVINPDAICYLYSAEAVGSLGWHGAMHLCPQAIWPFYSILIFALVQFSHLSYTLAAFVLNGLFSILSVIAFIAIVRELGGSRRAMWLAALVILFAHDFNILRQDIIRDHGFWALYLSSVFFLLRYFRQPSGLSALWWSVSLLGATLFRVESIIFLIALPLMTWFNANWSWGKRSVAFLILNFPLLILTAIALSWLLWHPQHNLNQWGRIAEVGHQLQSGLTLVFDKYQLTKAAISQNVLTHVSLRDANSVVFLLMISWYVVNIVASLSLIYTLLVIYAWLTKAGGYTRSAHCVIWGYMAINLVITFMFFAENHFLAKRYLVALSLILMLWVPFALNKLLFSAQVKQRVLGWLALVFVFVSAMGGIFHFGHSKLNIRQAGDWLAENVPEKATLYANDYQLMYYSHHFGSTIFKKFEEYKDVSKIAQGHWSQYDYLALLVSKQKNDKVAQVMQEIHLPPTQVFVSKDGDHVYIYKIARREKKS